MSKPKVAFICVHNSCRSQIAEALGKHLAADVFECYSAGTEVTPQINQDAVRLVKQLYGIDMEATQRSKLLADIPPVDIVVTMGCNVQCPFLPCKHREDWGLDDPSGKSDAEFEKTIQTIERKLLDLKECPNLRHTESSCVERQNIYLTNRVLQEFIQKLIDIAGSHANILVCSAIVYK